ncbi:melatonin receptor type 1B-A-like [Apostichopus japonicus]|uniref:melatonin receptor type 1B-A-like n=1 Tax=Stichopus japonicus TaxID=307972 RepID=UPI003AB7E86C
MNKLLSIYGHEMQPAALIKMNRTQETDFGQDDVISMTFGIFLFESTLMIVVLASVGNIMVIISIIRKKALHHSANILLVNLALADFLTTVCSIPSLGLRYLWPDFLRERQTLCETFLLLLMVCMCSSMTSMQCISINRYIFITKTRATYNRFFGTRKTSVMAMVIWIWSGVSIFLTLHVCGTLEYSTSLGGCYLKEGDPRSWFCLLAVILASVVLCIFIMPTFSLLTLNVIRESRKRVRDNLCSTKDGQKQTISKEEVAVTQMMLTVLGLFLICWIPYSAVHFWSYEKYPPKAVSFTVSVFALLNTAVNPFIYAWMNKPIRKSLIEMISKA